MKRLFNDFLVGAWPSFDTIEDRPFLAIPIALLMLGQYFFVVGLVGFKKIIETVFGLRPSS